MRKVERKDGKIDVNNREDVDRADRVEQVQSRRESMNPQQKSE
jgi:hypothetical protein